MRAPFWALTQPPALSLPVPECELVMVPGDFAGNVPRPRPTPPAGAAPSLDAADGPNGRGEDALCTATGMEMLQELASAAEGSGPGKAARVRALLAAYPKAGTVTNAPAPA